MRRVSLAFLLLSAASLFAERKVTSISPNVGLTVGSTHVLIRGNELVPEFVHCQDQCQNPGPCPVTVLFGNVPAQVSFALPEYIVLEVPARSDATVDVTVRVQNREDIVIANGFRFDTNAVVGPGDYDRYLVPVLGHEVPGANGSLWTTELTVHNALPQTAVVLRAPTCTANPPSLFCTDIPLEPGESESLRLQSSSWGSAAAYVYVPKAVSSSMPMELRTRDLSRESEGWGTEIPVVRLHDFSIWKQVLDVPTDPRYRATLRIYSASQYPLRVKVRVLPPNGDDAIAEQSLVLTGVATFDPVEFPMHPAYAQLDPLTSAVRASGHATVRIEVMNDDHSLADPPMSIWAFVSITNNKTQQVTAITPH